MRVILSSASLPGANPMVTCMAIAHMTAQHIKARLAAQKQGQAAGAAAPAKSKL